MKSRGAVAATLTDKILMSILQLGTRLNMVFLTPRPKKKQI